MCSDLKSCSEKFLLYVENFKVKDLLETNMMKSISKYSAIAWTSGISYFGSTPKSFFDKNLLQLVVAFVLAMMIFYFIMFLIEKTWKMLSALINVLVYISVFVAALAFAFSMVQN